VPRFLAQFAECYVILAEVRNCAHLPSPHRGRGGGGEGGGPSFSAKITSDAGYLSQ